MNYKNYGYIRTLLNGSYCTDEILNRIFCLNDPEVMVNDWSKLPDTEALRISKWIKNTDQRVRSEKLKAKLRARYWANKKGRELANANYQEIRQSS